MKISEDWFVDFLHGIAKDKKLLKEFLRDLLTVNEYKQIVLRCNIIGLLSDGLTHREVAKKLNVSITTVSHGANMLKNVKGGFNHVLQYELSKRSK